MRIKDTRRALMVLPLLAVPLHAGAQALPTAGCPMAHCDAHLSGATNVTLPGTLLTSSHDTSNGSNAGLGCSSNLTTVACSISDASLVSPVHLRVYKYDPSSGTHFSESFHASSGDLGNYAWFSAPIVFPDTTNGSTTVQNVLAVDATYVNLFQSDTSSSKYHIQWRAEQAYLDAGGTKHSLGGQPISPVMINDHIVLLATRCAQNFAQCPVSTYDLNSSSGYTVSQVQLQDNITTSSGTTVFSLQTVNTPTVDQKGSQGARVYILMSKACTSSQTDCKNSYDRGTLVALDVDSNGHITAANNSVSGNVQLSSLPSGYWFQRSDFYGPSGSSPALIKTSQGNRILFDGFSTGAPNPVTFAGDAAFYGVLDTGTSSAQLTWSWTTPFSLANSWAGTEFQAAAVVDSDAVNGPSIWVYPIVPATNLDGSGPVSCSQGSPHYIPEANCLVQLRASDGTKLRHFDLGPLLSAKGCASTGLHYAPSSAPTSAVASNGHTVLIVGAYNGAGLNGSGISQNPPVVAGIEITSTSSQTASWCQGYPNSSSDKNDAFNGQFSIALDPYYNVNSPNPVVAFTSNNQGLHLVELTAP